MSRMESYNRLDSFIENNPQATVFTVDDDNHNMGLVSCAEGDDSRRLRATTVRLSRSEISNFMRTHGFQCVPAESGTGILCSRPTDTPTTGNQQ